MPGFIRVRSAVGPKHIFSAPVESVEAWPEDYIVVDKTIYDRPAPEEHVFEESPKASAAGVKSVGDPEREGDA